MKLGFVSAILDTSSFEEVVDFASENRFKCIEMACWPIGKVERRYAGVTHIDVSDMDNKKADYIKGYLKEKGVEISGLGYYPNPLDPEKEKRELYTDHIKKIIKYANQLGLEVVNTFVGKDRNKTIDENFKMFKEVWTPLVKFAEENDVKICIENCPMYFTKDEWPGGLNLASTPAIWKRMFEEIPSPNFGLNYDPSHLLWQQIDYIRPIYDFKDKIFHIHIKDIKIYREKMNQVGNQATPLEYISPKLPGLGDIEWGKFISALTDIRYKGSVCIEVEDKAFEDTIEDKKKSIILSRNYINQFLY